MRISTLASRVRAEFFPARDEFDRAHGTNTAGLVSLFRLRIGSANRRFGVRYEPCGPAFFNSFVDGIERDRTFIDLGCGKGRVLIMAREVGFRRVVGVEFSAVLADIARKQCHFAEVITEDAAEYVFPKERLCVFMYNPFGLPVLSKVVSHLPSDSIVVYVSPQHPMHIPTVRVGSGFRVYRT